MTKSRRAHTLLQWGLAGARFVQEDRPELVPNEAECEILVIAMLLAAGIAFSELVERTLTLTDENRACVARHIREHLTPCVRDFCGGELDHRLSQLVGSAVTRLRIEC